MENMIKSYIIEQLKPDSVNLLVTSKVRIDGTEYSLPNVRSCYPNSILGRQRIEYILPEPYLSAVLDVWGDEPTIVDPEQPIQQPNNSDE